MERSTRSPVSRVRNDMRSLATGIETYYLDNGAYPLMVPLATMVEGDPDILIRAGGGHMQTMTGMTTPIAYITSYFVDPFVKKAKVTFAYEGGKNGWILVSPGPDRRYDIHPRRDFDADNEATITEQLLLLSFDPTNGTTSTGDVWRVGQR